MAGPKGFSAPACLHFSPLVPSCLFYGAGLAHGAWRLCGWLRPVVPPAGGADLVGGGRQGRFLP